MQFEKNKTYLIEIQHPERGTLFFTAHNIQTTPALISFIDKNGQGFLFDADWVRQGKEVRE